MFYSENGPWILGIFIQKFKMNSSKLFLYFATLFCVASITLNSCNSVSEEKKATSIIEEQKDKSKLNDELKFTQTLQNHLDAVSNKDLKSLQSTLSPDGAMILILPGSETTTTVTEFMDYHKEWFAVPDWTFETEILYTDIGDHFGMAITEIVYREPNRDGVPYFNRMTVSYDLKKIDGNWYIVKDHASSIEKSTDTK